MKKLSLIALTGALMISSTSCVTKKKFLLAENGRIEALSRGDKLQGQLNECHNEMDKMRGQIDQLQQDTNQKGNSIRHYQQLLSSNMNEQEKLNALLGEKLKELAAQSTGKSGVKSPLPGVILDIKVNVGDTVKKGQTIIILEAMKMENNINADKDGKITAINVNKGDSVLEGNDLVIIE